MPKGRNGRMPSSPADRHKEPEVLDVPVSFSGFSAGDETAKIGLVIDRAKITLKQAEHFLCGARLEVELAADANAEEDGAGQATFWEDADVLKSVVDCRSYRVTPKRIGAGLTFSLEAIDVGDLVHLAKQIGRLRAKRIGDAETKRAAKSEDAEGQQILEGAER